MYFFIMINPRQMCERSSTWTQCLSRFCIKPVTVHELGVGQLSARWAHLPCCLISRVMVGWVASLVPIGDSIANVSPVHLGALNSLH